MTLSVAHADLEDHAKKYTALKKKLGGTPEKKEKIVEEELRPILIEIGKLDSEPSLAFLDKEYRSARGPLAAACARGMLENSSEAALVAVFKGLAKRLPKIVGLILGSVVKAERDLGVVERAVLGLLSSKDTARIENLPGVAAKLNNLDAAKALVSSVRAPKGKKGKSPAANQARQYNDSVAEALAKFDSDDVKGWLADGAWKRSSAARTEVLLRVAGQLKLEDARPHILKHLSSKKEKLVIAAVVALQGIGLGDAVEEIAAALQKKVKRSPNFKISILDALAGAEDDAGLEVVLAVAKSDDPTMRTIAVGSLGLAKNAEKAFEGIARGLEDEERTVRNAALRALSGYRTKAMVGPLIAFLEKEQTRKLRVDALKHLIRVTGKNMGLEVADWKSWWEVTEASFEVPKGKKEFTSVKTRGLDYFGLEVSSDRISFLVDISGSMTQKVPIKKRSEDDEDGKKGGTRVRKKKEDEEKDDDKDEIIGEARKIDILKKELVRVLKKLPAGISINITSFDANYKSWKKKLHPLKRKGRAQAISFVEKIQNGSGTNVFDTLEHALKDKRVDTIFLLTDGNPSRGRITDPDLIAQEIRVLNRIRGATIHGIAFGAESELLKTLAAENGGEYRFVDSY